MMIRQLFSLTGMIIALTLMVSVPALHAAEKIIAVVNDGVITSKDVEARVALSMANTGLPNTPEVQQKIAPQVLRTLIDETLQLQEADRLHITVSDDEIKGAMSQMAQQNNIPVDQLDSFLAAKGVPVSAMKKQIRSAIAWGKVAQRRLRPSISVGDNEIDAELERIKASAGKKEYLLSEIFLAVDDPSQDDEAKHLGERIIEQLSHGANFMSMARQFSQSATAATGGDMGWIQEGQLGPELDRALQAAQPGMLSPPLRDPSGYHILGVRKVRVAGGTDPDAVTLDIKQLLFPFSLVKGEKDPKGALKAKVESVTATLKDCDAMTTAMDTYKNPMNGDLKDVKLGSIPPAMAQILGSLDVGKPSLPLVNEEGALIMMICRKDAPEVAAPSRDQINYNLMVDRMTLMQRRLLRDLRQAAFIDIRS